MSVLFEHRLRLAGTQTRVLEVDGKGPPLLMLHGYADSADTWRAMLDRFVHTGRRAIALDMPGFGTAEPLSPSDRVLPQLDRFVGAALVRFAGDESAVIVGNSLGGCVALRAAEKEKLPIAGVVPIAPAGPALARWIAIVQGEALVRGVLSSPLPVPKQVVRQVVAQMYRRFAFADSGRVDSRAISGFCSHLETRSAAARILETGGRIRNEIADPFEHLDRIECPVMIIWGDRDRMTPISGAERFTDEIEHARLEVIEGYGHCPQVEAPERVTELVEQFCDELAPVAS